MSAHLSAEEFQHERNSFSALLFGYFIVTLILYLPPWIGLLPPLERALQHIRGFTIGKTLYCLLPLSVWIYSRFTRSPWNVIFLYLLLEGGKHILRLIPNLRDVFSPFGIIVLPIVVLSAVCLYMVYKMYIKIRRLAELQKESDNRDGEPSGPKDPLLLQGAVMLWILFSYFAMAVDLRQNTLELFQLPIHEVHAKDKYIQDLSASPDGKLLAVGTQWSLSIWDVGQQRRIWYGKDMGATRVRFSLDGRYLAAYGGEGSHEREEGVVNVLEVDGFRKLPPIQWPQEVSLPQGEKARRRVHSAAFRPDGNGLLIAWDYSQGPLFCMEVDPRTGHVLHTQTLDVRKLVNLDVDDRLPLESAYFSPDASRMLLLDWAALGMKDERFLWFDTRTWESKELRTKEYEAETVMNDEDRATADFRLSLENNRLCFFASTRGKYGEDWHFVLLGLDPETQKENMLLTAPEGGWIDFSLSPDGKRAAFVGPNEIRKKLGEKAGLTLVRIADLGTGESRLIPLKFDSEWPGIYVQRVMWLTNDTLAIGLTSSMGFFIASADQAKL